jgi:hypothetical protein
METLKRGLASIVSGALQMITERDNDRLIERIRLIGYMQDTFPQIIPALSQIDADEVNGSARQDAIRPSSQRHPTRLGRTSIEGESHCGETRVNGGWPGPAAR